MLGIDQWDNINRFILQLTALKSSVRPNCIHMCSNIAAITVPQCEKAYRYIK